MRAVRRVLAVLASLAALAPVAWLGSGPAWAACPERPERSTASFTGKVDRVDTGGHRAFVTTSDNRQVVVLGTGAPTTDPPRTYVAGETYEFHPLNGASPYLDSACTATRAVGDSLWSAETILILAVIAAMVLSAPRIARWIRRRWGPPPHAAPPDEDARPAGDATPRDEADAGPLPPDRPPGSP